jgi:transposase
VETASNGVKSLTEVEVVAKAERRPFTAQYKQKVLREADDCKQPGEIGGLLRREGLYWSNLANWRKQRERGELAGLSTKKRGPRRREKNPLAERVRELERNNTRLKRPAERAEGIVGCKKKSRRFSGSNWKSASRQIDGDGERGQGIVFSAIDLRRVGNCAGQLLPMATTGPTGCKRTDSSSGLIGQRATRGTGGC